MYGKKTHSLTELLPQNVKFNQKQQATIKGHKESN